MIKSLTATITCVPESNSRSSKTIGRGYRGILHYIDTPVDMLHAVEVLPFDGPIAGNETGNCEIKFLYPEFNTQEFAVKRRKFEIRDGNTLRATGTVTSVRRD